MADDYNKIKAVKERDAPNRCQKVNPRGQCTLEAIEGLPHCHLHSTKELRSKAKEEQKMYNLAKWQARVESFADHDELKTLNSEIGILRMVLETTINLCSDEKEILLQSGKISDMILKLEKLVNTCSRLEYQTGRMLDKAAVLRLASKILEIITLHIKDPTLCELIGNSIIESVLNEVTNPDDKE